MSDGDNDLIARVADSTWLKALDRIAIPVLVFAAIAFYNNLAETAADVNELKLKVGVIISEQANIKRDVSEAGERSEAIRTQRQRDWQDVRAEIAALKVQVQLILQQQDANSRKLDSLIERFPTRKSETEPGKRAAL